MRELKSLLVYQTSGRMPLLIGNIEGILGIEKLNAKHFELNLVAIIRLIRAKKLVGVSKEWKKTTIYR